MPAELELDARGRRLRRLRGGNAPIPRGACWSATGRVLVRELEPADDAAPGPQERAGVVRTGHGTKHRR